MEWTNKERLQLVSAIAENSLDGPIEENYKMLMVRIFYLCNGAPEFLEANKRNFEDVIDKARLNNGST